MANLLIAITTLAIGAVLISFGAYQGHYSMKRTEYTTRVNSSISRTLTYMNQSKVDLGRLPGVADLSAARIAREQDLSGVNLTVGSTATYSWVCAKKDNAQPWLHEAMQRVQPQWSNSFVTSTCDCNACAYDPAGTAALTVRMYP